MTFVQSLLRVEVVLSAEHFYLIKNENLPESIYACFLPAIGVGATVVGRVC